MPATNLAPITLTQVTVNYQSQPVLQGLDLSFAAHGISFLLGENGAGKTQILRCIHGLNTPNNGMINAPPRHQQALLYQEPTLLHRSVADNLRFIRGCPVAPAAYFDQQFEAVVARFSLHDLLPQPALTLSGGQRKRVALARLFLQRATCYLFDEPGANIDRKNNRIIENAINECAENGHKVIVTTHDFLQLERLFTTGRDELLIIKNGRLACTAKHPSRELFHQYL